MVLHLRPQVQHAADGAGARDGAGRLSRAAAALHGAALARPLHLRLLPALRYLHAVHPHCRTTVPPLPHCCAPTLPRRYCIVWEHTTILQYPHTTTLLYPPTTQWGSRGGVQCTQVYTTVWFHLTSLLPRYCTHTLPHYHTVVLPHYHTIVPLLYHTIVLSHELP